MVYSIVLGLFIFSWCGASAVSNDFITPTLTNGCACPGDVLNYSCTFTEGLIIAIWSGTALTCPLSADRILLTVDLFQDNSGVGGTQCGPLTVTSVSVDNSTGMLCYSSVVSANISTGMNSQTVSCSRNIIGNVIGSPHMLSVAGAAPVSLSASSIDQSRFTFSWTPTVTCSSVTSYQVNADVANCGNCRYDGTGTNTATCSGWAANGQTCSVSVMSVICGGRTGEPSGSLDFVLQEPELDPQAVSIKPRYPQSTGILSSLSVSFPTVSPVQVAPGLSPPVTYSVRINSDARVFPESNCSGGVCTWTFTDFPAEDFNFAVAVSNGLAAGQPTPSVKVPNNISSVVSLTVQVMESNATFTLNLLEDFVGATNMTLEYRTGLDVLNASSSSTASAGGSLSLTLTSLQVGAVYTYSLFFTQDGMMTEIQGTFSARCQPEGLCASTCSTIQCSTGGFVGGVNIDNGEVCYTGTTPGGGFFAETICDDGFSGSPRRECQMDGTWSGSTSVCMRIPTPFPLWVIAIIIVLLLVLLLVLICIGYAVYRHKKGKTEVSTEVNQLGPVYEEPDYVKPDPHTERNVAYGQVQFTH